MPVYEFACNACGARTSLFVRSVRSPVAASCQRCGSQDLRRLISRVTVLRSAGGGSLDDLEGLDESDPRSLARWARRLREELGEDAGPEFDEMVQRLERGEPLEDGLGDDEEGLDDGSGEDGGRDV